MSTISRIQTMFQKHASDLPERLDAARFAQFLELLNRWNRVYNLTAIRSEDEQIRLHFLDSLSIGKHLLGTRFLDVGSGGGFPGIPLALAFPEQEWTLIEKSEKKCRFLTQAVMELQLTNVRVAATRVEAYRPDVLFDGIVSRAFASLVDFVTLTSHLLAANGVWYAMKGVYPKDEVGALPEKYKCTHHRLALSGLPEERHLVCIQTRK